MKNITIDELLAYFDEQHPNQHSRDEKLSWLGEIEERIYDEIIRPRLPQRYIVTTITSDDVTHSVLVFLTMYDYNRLLGSAGTSFDREDINTVVQFTAQTGDVGKEFGTFYFNGFDNDTDGETILIVPSMFKDLYRYWLEQKSSMKNREVGAANNALAMFQAAYDDFYANYNRKNASTEDKRIIFRG